MGKKYNCWDNFMDKILNLHFPIARPPWTELGRRLESMWRKALYEFELLERLNKVAIV